MLIYRRNKNNEKVDLEYNAWNFHYYPQKYILMNKIKIK